MENNELKTIIENARLLKGYSQRELSKKIGLSQSTYNDTINGRIKKPDINILIKIAEELELSLQLLLKASGYKEVADWFTNDEFKNNSNRNLKNIIDEYRVFKDDILNWDANKIKKAEEVIKKLLNIKMNIKKIQNGQIDEYDFDNIIDDIDKIIEELELIVEKFDYSKLLKDL